MKIFLLDSYFCDTDKEMTSTFSKASVIDEMTQDLQPTMSNIKVEKI